MEVVDIDYNCLKSVSPRGHDCMARRSHRLHGQGGSIEPEGAGLGPWSGQSPVRAAVFDAATRF